MLSEFKSIPVSFALTAFVVSVLAGLGVGNSALDVLVRSIIAMVVCYAAGLLASRVLEYIVEEYVVLYKSTRPIEQTSLPAPSGETIHQRSTDSKKN